MRAAPVLIGLGILAVGGIALAAGQDEGNPPLPIPPGKDCVSSTDVAQILQDILADPANDTPEELRAWAASFRQLEDYCDDTARAAGQSAAQVLEAKANGTMIPGNIPPINPTPNFPLPPGVPPLSFPGIPGMMPPPGYNQSGPSLGLHDEWGMYYHYPNGDEWFVPNDSSLIPYYIPGGTSEIPRTQGACCAACERGEECEGCG